MMADEVYRLNKKKQINIENKRLTIILCFFGLIIFSLISLLINNLVALTWISFIQLLFGIFLLKYKNGSIFSFSVIFYVLCYLFHCSYYWLLLTQNYMAGNLWVFRTLSTEVQVETLKICIMFFSFFPLGSLLIFRRNNRTHKLFMSFETCANVGNIIMAICIIPRSYVDIQYLMMYLAGGYKNSFNVQFNNYFIVLADLFYLGASLSILGYQRSRAKAKGVLFITVLMVVLGMLSGRRMVKVTYLIVILYLYFKYNSAKSINKTKIVMFAVMAYVFLVIIGTIGDVRTTGELSFNIVMKYLGENFSYKLLVDQLGEFGYAAYSLGACVEYFASETMGYGVNYLTAWLQVLPNIGGIITGLSDELSFVLQLPSVYQKALGGSIIGELYYNFGVFLAIPSFLLGGILTKVTVDLDDSIDNGYISQKGMLSILLFSPTLMWIRSTFNEFPRAVVWYFIIVYMLKIFLRSKNEY